MTKEQREIAQTVVSLMVSNPDYRLVDRRNYRQMMGKQKGNICTLRDGSKIIQTLPGQIFDYLQRERKITGDGKLIPGRNV